MINKNDDNDLPELFLWFYMFISYNLIVLTELFYLFILFITLDFFFFLAIRKTHLKLDFFSYVEKKI